MDLLFFFFGGGSFDECILYRRVSKMRALCVQGRGVKKGQKLRAHYMDGPWTGLGLSITKVERSILQKDKLAHSSREIKRWITTSVSVLVPGVHIQHHLANHHRAVCSWPSDILTCFELVLEDTEATSLFLGFFRLDLNGPWLPE